MWIVEFTGKATKQLERLPVKIQEVVALLVAEIEVDGPVRHNWPNFSKLKGRFYHCHIKKGRPTYVACWSIENKKAKIIEVYYVGSHENAPY